MILANIIIPEQAKKTNIYFIVATPNPKHDYLSRVKIGVSKNVQERLNTLQIGNPIKLNLWYSFPVNAEKGIYFEHQLHQKFRWSRKNGEWFKIHPCIREFVKTHKQFFGNQDGMKIKIRKRNGQSTAIEKVLKCKKCHYPGTERTKHRRKKRNPGKW